MAIVVSSKNRREMSEERDFKESVPITKRYCILSSPRSGSTLLSRMLYETRAAGDPQEYFNPPLLQYERERSGNPKLSLNGFMKLVESRRTSPNGVFGMKLHYFQMLGAFRSRTPNQAMVGMLNKFDHLIWIRRRDKVRQAISQSLGQRTQVWSSEDEKFGTETQVDIHPYDIVRTLQIVCGDDMGWERFLKTTGLVVHEVWYEELVDDYRGQCRQVLEYLGLSNDVAEIPPQPLQRQSSGQNERLYANFIDYLGFRDPS